MIVQLISTLIGSTASIVFSIAIEDDFFFSECIQFCFIAVVTFFAGIGCKRTMVVLINSKPLTVAHLGNIDKSDEAISI